MRNLRGEYGIHPGTRVSLRVRDEQGTLLPLLQRSERSLADLGRIDAVSELLWDMLNHTNKEDLRDVDKLRHDVSDVVRRFVQKRTNLRPMVLPTIVQV